MKNIKKILVITSFTLIWIACDNIENKTTNLKADKVSIQIGGKKSDIPFIFESKKQSINDRIWKKIFTNFDFILGGLDDTTFYSPTRVKSDSEGNIYVLDMQGCYVKKFDENGKFLRKYGSKGQGPNEFTGPFRFDISPKGQIVILDPNLNKCVVFSEKRNYYVKCRYQPSDVCFVSEDEIVILQEISPIENSCLRKYNFKTDKVEDYQNILDTKKIENLNVGALPFLYGYLVSSSNNHLIYVPKFMSIFINFSNHGTIQDAFKTIDYFNFPEIEQKSYKLTDFRLPKEFHSSLSAFVDDDKLLIWNYKLSRQLNMPVIDFYEIEQGKYLYSIKVERISKELRVFGLYISNNKIYILNENSQLEIYKYRYENI